MPQISIGQDTKMTSGLVLEYQTVSSSSYTLTSTSGGNGGFDYAIGCDSTSNAITINLPVNSTNGLEVGRMYYIFDKAGTAGSNNITIDPRPSGTGTISGATDYVINSNYNSITLMCVDETAGAGVWIII